MFLESQKEINLEKSLSTLEYNPGEYPSKLIVDYGELLTTDLLFKLGELNLGLLNYTSKINLDGLKKFEIGIENKWNKKMDNVYAEVVFLDKMKIVNSIKTSSISLNSWETATLLGFLDTSNFTKGVYDTNITLFYSGQSSSELVKVEFISQPIETKTILIILGILICLVAGLILIKRYFPKRNGKK